MPENFDILRSTFSQQVLSPSFVLQMMLKISSQINWSTGEVNTHELTKFISLMIELSKEGDNTSIEEAMNTQNRMEQQLHESWESLIEKVEK
jgi:hypothetical protein